MFFFQRIIFFLFLTCGSSCAFMHAHNDLEEISQDFFLEIKKITLPNYPHAFNPSIIQWKGRWLMSFRLVSHPEEVSSVFSATESDIGLIYLDDELNPVGNPQFISLDHPKMKRPHILAEDARLIVKGGCLYVVYSGNKEEIIEDSGFRVYVAQLDSDKDGFFVVHNECLSSFEGANPERREKNWTPFIYESDLLLSYGLFPHRIFRPYLDGSEHCETIANSLPSFIWEWGELRGGTPAVKLDENYYLGFFHSSTWLKTVHSGNKRIPHYFIGAYLFSSTPPFEIKYISPEPIIGRDFYHGSTYEPYWHPVCVVFPCGIIVNEKDVWVTYGRQDHEIWIAKLDKKKLLKSLIHVSTCGK